MRELDSNSTTVMTQVENQVKEIIDNIQEMNQEERVQKLLKLKESFKGALKSGEEKVAMAIQTYEMVDRHIRRLDDDLLRFEEEQMTGPKLLSRLDRKSEKSSEKRSNKNDHSDTPKSNKRSRQPRQEEGVQSQSSSSNSNNNNNNQRQSSNQGKSRTNNARNKREESTSSNNNSKKNHQNNETTTEEVLDLPVDPNEPLYCICQQVSYGEMIACDNEDCDIEWFHYACVGLSGPPKGKWFCPECSNKKRK